MRTNLRCLRLGLLTAAIIMTTFSSKAFAQDADPSASAAGPIFLAPLAFGSSSDPEMQLTPRGNRLAGRITSTIAVSLASVFVGSITTGATGLAIGLLMDPSGWTGLIFGIGGAMAGAVIGPVVGALVWNRATTTIWGRGRPPERRPAYLVPIVAPTSRNDGVIFGLATQF